MIPSGFAETGNQELQDEIVEIARKHGVRLLGPNIYGYYYTPENLCATFCTPYDVKGGVALTSQCGGIGMAILGFSRTTKMGVSAIVGLGNKSDLDEDDLLTFFEQDDNTNVRRDAPGGPQGRPRRSSRPPSGSSRRSRSSCSRPAAPRWAPGRRARTPARWPATTRSTTTSCARPGVVRAPGLNDMLEYARGAAAAADAEGRERRHHHRRGRLRRAAVRRLRRQRPVADGHPAGPRRGVPRVHPAVRRGGQPDRHHRWRAAVDVRGHDPARPGGRRASTR